MRHSLEQIKKETALLTNELHIALCDKREKGYNMASIVSAVMNVTAQLCVISIEDEKDINKKEMLIEIVMEGFNNTLRFAMLGQESDTTIVYRPDSELFSTQEGESND